MLARRPESLDVLKAFLETEMAVGCRLLTAAEARRRCPALEAPDLLGVLESTTELRVESRFESSELREPLFIVFGQTHLLIAQPAAGIMT